MTRIIQFAAAVALTLAFAAAAQANLTGYWRSIHTTCDVTSPSASAAELSEVKQGQERTYWLWLLLQPNDDEVLGLTSLHDLHNYDDPSVVLGDAQAWMQADLSPEGDKFEWSWNTGYMAAEVLSPHHLRLTYTSIERYFVTAECVRYYLRVPAPPPSVSPHELAARAELDELQHQLDRATFELSETHRELAELEVEVTTLQDQLALAEAALAECEAGVDLCAEANALAQGLAACEAAYADLSADAGAIRAAEQARLKKAVAEQEAIRVELELTLTATAQGLAACEEELLASRAEREEFQAAFAACEAAYADLSADTDALAQGFAACEEELLSRGQR